MSRWMEGWMKVQAGVSGTSDDGCHFKSPRLEVCAFCGADFFLREPLQILLGRLIWTIE